MKVMKITIPELNADKPGMLDSKELKKLNDFKFSLQASCIIYINSNRGFAEDITRHKRWLTDKLDSGKNAFARIGFKFPFSVFVCLFCCFVILHWTQFPLPFKKDKGLILRPNENHCQFPLLTKPVYTFKYHLLRCEP